MPTAGIPGGGRAAWLNRRAVLSRVPSERPRGRRPREPADAGAPLVGKALRPGLLDVDYAGDGATYRIRWNVTTS